MGEILSQKEIDELINSLSSGEIDVKEIQSSNEKKVKEYNFHSPSKFAKDHLRTLNFIHENYARMVTNFLTGYLRTSVQVDVEHVQALSFFEFTNSIPDPAVLAKVDFSPLKGSIILEISPNIVFAIIDRILGGKCAPIEKVRNFTEIEMAIIERVVIQLIGFMREAWENIIPLKPGMLEKIETNAQFIQYKNPNEMVAIVTLSSKIGDVEDMINICIPYMVVEPIMPKLTTRLWFSVVEAVATKESRENIEKKLEKSKVPIKAILGKTSITVGDFIDLQCGDVIPLDVSVNSDVNILVGNILKFRGKPGLKKNKISVKITEIVKKDV